VSKSNSAYKRPLSKLRNVVVRIRSFNLLYYRLLSIIIYCFSRKRENTRPQMLQMQLQPLGIFIKSPLLPSGYLIRSYIKGDESDWVRIIKRSFGKRYEPPEITINNILTSPHFENQSLLFITYYNCPIGTVWGSTMFSGWNKIGCLQMIAIIPEHRSKGLGLSLCYACLQYFKKKGIKRVILFTDDFRVQAIKIYRELGFKPLEVEPSHRERWAKIFKKDNLEKS
jgi:mycothiol synthase